MPHTRRTLAVLVVCVLALVCSSCKSNNEGKIVGRWKNTSPFEGAPAGTVFLEFTTDGKLTMTVQNTPVLTAAYRLSSGDYIVLSDVKVHVPTADNRNRGGRFKVTIKGESMTWVEQGSTMQLARDN